MNVNASEFSPACNVVHNGGSATQRVIPQAPDHAKTEVATTQPSGGRPKKERSRRDGKTASGAAPKTGAPQAKQNGKGVSNQAANSQSKESSVGKGTNDGTKTKPATFRRKPQHKVKKDEPSESAAEPVARPAVKRGGRGGRRGRGGRPHAPLGKRVIEDDAMSVSSVASSQSTLSSMSSLSSASITSNSDLPLREHLERDLSKEKYRCAICMEFIRKEQKIWSCPHCYVVLHMFCMKEWMFSNLDTATRDSLPKQARSVSRAFFSFPLTPRLPRLPAHARRALGADTLSAVPHGAACPDHPLRLLLRQRTHQRPQSRRPACVASLLRPHLRSVARTLLFAPLRRRVSSGPLPPLQRHHPHEVSLRPHRVSLFPSPHPQTDGALRHRPRHRAL